MAVEIAKKEYKAIFFDLDHTLWDFDSNSRNTLTHLFESHIQPRSSAKLDRFLRIFKKVNDDLWDAYNKGAIDKDVIRERRFSEIFRWLEIDNEDLAKLVSTEYLFKCPRQPSLINNAIEVLEYLSPKYPLHILTNGFGDVQSIKMQCSGITSYFQSVITSESAGHKKPAEEFFNHALQSTQNAAHEAIMIGDNLKTDIAGAINASIDTVYFNPGKNGRPHRATYSISDLMELTNIL